jgi:predicted secreted Zn-dependent protease
MGALLKHEMNHLRFAVNTAKEIKETIYNSRNLTDKQLQQRLGYLIQKNQEFDFEYDQETRNGLHEGVSLDPNAC